ncbi:MAG TPA: hypothetical protein ENI51_07825 [Candidatus Atribacteria bacterium]|nr:hypothetical protein [Candidatus Atribacteria bacterium]
MKDKIINIRIDKKAFKVWENYYKTHKFDTMSSFVRYCVDTFIENNGERFNKKENINDKILEYEDKINEIIDENKEILRLLAERIENEKDIDLNNDLINYQKYLLLTLIQEKPRDDEELIKILNIDADVLYVMLNKYLELGKIKMNRLGKYELI